MAKKIFRRAVDLRKVPVQLGSRPALVPYIGEAEDLEDVVLEGTRVLLTDSYSKFKFKSLTITKAGILHIDNSVFRRSFFGPDL